MGFDELKESIPVSAKDIKLNLDAVIKRSILPEEVAAACAIAAAYAAKMDYSPFLELTFQNEANAALVAATLMGMNNIWYPYVEMTADSELKGLPANLRMTAYTTSGGTDKDRFEAYALAASIVGKCHFCVKSHYDLLKNTHGWGVKQLQDVGRIAATINAVSLIQCQQKYSS